VEIDHLAEAEAGNQTGGGGNGDPTPDVRVTGDDGARGFRERDDPRGTFERFESPRDLRLLDCEAVRRQSGVGFVAQIGTDVGDPPIELVEAEPAALARAEVRVDFSRRPQPGELPLVEMSPAEALKK
jgi:hypothetical protein